MKRLLKQYSILGFLVFCAISNAQIVYTDITPDCESTMNTTTGFASNLCPIDFGNNATIEYSFRWDDWVANWFMHMTYGANSEIALNGTTTNAFGGRFIKPLQLNEVIDGSLTWGTSFPEPFIGETTVNQNFLNLGDRYVGVKFTIGANTYYGWVLVNFENVGNSRKITVKSYAYNGTPNTQILAGQTAALSAVSNQIIDNQIKIYPIPAKEVIYIEGIDDAKFQYVIINKLGQIVCQKESSSNKIIIEDLPIGVFNLMIITPNGLNISKKIIKQ